MKITDGKGVNVVYDPVGKIKPYPSMCTLTLRHDFAESQVCSLELSSRRRRLRSWNHREDPGELALVETGERGWIVLGRRHE
jgi:hypothetical protein